LRSRLLFIAATLFGIGLATSVVLARHRADDAKEPADETKPSQLAKAPVGIWALADTSEKPEDSLAKAYANENTSSLIGKTHHLTIKVEGDMYTQLGQENQYSEVWKRVKSSRPRPPGLAS
jgi:hypothetical protein